MTTLVYPKENDPDDSLRVLPLTRENQYNPDSLALFEQAADAAIVDGIRIIAKQNLLGVKRDGQTGMPPVVYSPSQNRFFTAKANTIPSASAGRKCGNIASIVSTSFNSKWY
jgi:hypothetical protein